VASGDSASHDSPEIGPKNVKLDAWLHSGDIRYGMEYIESGLDVPFDEESDSEFQMAMGSDAFGEYLEARVYATDQAANMDW